MTYSLENIKITNENGLNSKTYSNIRCLNDNSSNHYLMSNKNEAYINKNKNSDLIKIYSNSKAEYLINPLNKCNIQNHIDNNEKKNKLFRIKQSSRNHGYNEKLTSEENRSNIYKSINNQNKVSSSSYTSELKSVVVGKPDKYIKNKKFIHNQSDATINKNENVEELNKRIKSSYLSPDNSTKHGSYDRYLSKLKGKVYTKNLINSEVKFDDGNSIIKKTILFNMNCRNCR
tara:strand:- start:8241 stop:8933 length:693 start_codon:yes stop_codon:yes gene_type:complete